MGIPRGFKPRLYDRAHVEPDGYLAPLGQVDTAGFLQSELLSHEILDHGAVHRASNLPPMQNLESYGPASRVNTAEDLARFAALNGRRR